MTPTEFLKTWGPSGVVYDFEAGTVTWSFDQLETAVQAAIRAAVEQEREECAKIVADVGNFAATFGSKDMELFERALLYIRARSATSPSNNPE